MTLETTVDSDAAAAPAFEAARRICRKNARGFYHATFFLPSAKRDAACAVWAFAEMVKEAMSADAPALDGAAGMRNHPAVASPAPPLRVIQPQEDPECAIAGVDSRRRMLSERLDEIYSGQLELPSIPSRSPQQHALYAFALTIHRHDVPRQYFEELADGFREDRPQMRYANWQQLQAHCAHTGGALSLIVACVLGLTHSDAFNQARSLGVAMRLTSILRDIRRDWQLRRTIYIPRDELNRFDCRESDLAAGIVNDKWRSLMRFQVDRARELYRAAGEGICRLAGDGSRVSASLMALMHAGLLDAIEQSDYDLSPPPRVSAARKLRLFFRALRLAARPPDEPMPKVF